MLRLFSVVAIIWLLGINQGFSAGVLERAEDPVSLSDPESQADFDQLIEKSKSSMMGDPSAALDYALKAQETARSLPTEDEQSTAEATALWLRSEALIRINRTDEVRPLIKRALKLLGENHPESKLQGDLLLTLGRVSRLSGDVETALNSFHSAHDIFAKLNLTRSQSITLQSLGSVYNDARSFEKALQYHDRAQEVFSGDLALDMSSANNRARVLKELGRHDEALVEFTRAYEFSRELGSPLLQARILTNLASVHILDDQLNEANAITDEALSLLKGNDANGWSKFVWGIKAEIAIELGQPDNALTYTSRAFEDVDLETTTSPFRDMHEIAFHIFKGNGQYDLALQHHEAFKRLDDHGRDASSSANFALMGAQFEFANQALRIQQLKTGQLERDIELAEAQAKEQTLVLLGLTLLGLIAITWFSWYFISTRAHQKQIKAANVKQRETIDQLNLEIERRHETEKDLRAAKDIAEKANQSKTQFLANMSHELRTPLNAVIGFSEIIAGELMGAIGTPAYKDYANDILNSGKHLLSILNDILDMARIDSGKVALEESEFDLHRLITGTFNLFTEEVRGPEKSLILTCNEPGIVIRADERRIRQVFINLVSNAIKFTNAGGTINVIIEPVNGSSLKIVVEDDGIGIPTDKLDTILEPFSQVEEAYSRSVGGMGLGLPIVRSLVELHDGTFTVESDHGTGTRAIITLPQNRVTAQAA